MEKEIIIWLLTSFSLIAQTVILFKLNSSAQKNKCIDDRMRELEIEVTRLNGKIWSKKDLEDSVEEAVERVFLRYENKQLKQEKNNGS